MCRLNKTNKASVFTEYAVILTVAALAFTAMNVYMKRAVEGRTKDMTDYLISTKQIIDVDPDSITESPRDPETLQPIPNQTVADAVVGRGEREGGSAITAAVGADTKFAAQVNYLKGQYPDDVVYETSPFVWWQDFNVNEVPRPEAEEDEETVNNQVTEKEREAYQAAIQDREDKKQEIVANYNALINEANAKEQNADALRRQARDLKAKDYCPTSMPCREYYDEKQRLYAEARQLDREADNLREQAKPYGREINALQREIDRLQSEMNKLG